MGGEQPTLFKKKNLVLIVMIFMNFRDVVVYFFFFSRQFFHLKTCLKIHLFICVLKQYVRENKVWFLFLAAGQNLKFLNAVSSAFSAEQ